MGNDISSEAQDPPAATEQPPRAGTIPTCLRWPHGGKTAYICGSFTQWQKMPMQWRQTSAGGEWSKVVDLSPGHHQYKFIVDGQWRHDHTAPTVLDNLGNVNNSITVHADPSPNDVSMVATALPGVEVGGGAGGCAGGCCSSPHPTAMAHEQHRRDFRASDRTSSDPYHIGAKQRAGASSYSQLVPQREELLVQHSASLLLPQQLRLLLPQLLSDGPSEAPPPLPCQMHHVFVHSAADMIIFAMAHRYKDRSITQLLYKPVPSPSRDNEMDSASANVDAYLEGANPLSRRRPSEVRGARGDVAVQAVRIAGTQRHREDGGHEYVAYLVESSFIVHGMQTTLRSVRRYKHFHMLDQLLQQQFGRLVPQAMPAKRAFGNLQPGFVEERRNALERYLQLCLAIPELAASSTFCMFLEADGGMGQETDFTKRLHSSGLRLMEQVGTLQGYLLKQGRRVTAWKRRYFCVCEGEVHYYYSMEMSNPFQPLGVIPLLDKEIDGPDSATPFASNNCSVSVEDLSLSSHHFGFCLATRQRRWRLAADSERSRAEWVRMLCKAGARLCTVEGLPMLPSSWTLSSTPAEAEGAGGLVAMDLEEASIQGVSTSGEALSGTLWKRGSKVHITQLAESTSGVPREWVSRHFRLLPIARALVYLQRDDDPIAEALGVVELGDFCDVTDAQNTHEGLHAFQLVATGGGFDKSLLLAATSVNAKAAWMAALGGVLANANSGSGAADEGIGSVEMEWDSTDGANDVATAAQMVDGVSLQSSAGAADDAAGRTSS
uniref:PX domain-containing protein n=1 Tax=Calcidiscus leptoporus TaxID=127549 RepID=A0A7S0JEI5_9EUKA|mmetsp:Transcript_54389/g.125303  ORF Transcript_54389/g.125303 Transcript_54389/m.125303 type:complete len:776 (+) Transcript_54389:120-2447(+)